MGDGFTNQKFHVYFVSVKVERCFHLSLDGLWIAIVFPNMLRPDLEYICEWYLYNKEHSEDLSPAACTSSPGAGGADTVVVHRPLII